MSTIDDTTNSVVAPQSVTTAANRSLLAIRGLTIEARTDRGSLKVVEGLDLDVPAGRTLGLVGESGSGKTVTALSVLGLLPHPVVRVTSGSIVFDGVDLTRAPKQVLRRIRGNEISMVFQEPMSSLNPAYTIGDQIAEAVREHRKVRRSAAWARAVEVLDIVGIPSAARRAHEYPHTYSGGMRQRAMIAMALACEPRLLIADEPTTALDVTVQARILDLLGPLRREFGLTVVLVTHDLGVIAETCDEVAVMYAGQVVERGRTRDLFDVPRHPYSAGLLDSMPQLNADSPRLPSIRGVVPPPWALPTGCRFHPRCDFAVEACTEAPVAITRSSDRASRCLRSTELDLRRPT